MRPTVPLTELSLPRAWGLVRGTSLLPQPGSGSVVGSLLGPESGAPLVGRQPPPCRAEPSRASCLHPPARLPHRLRLRLNKASTAQK